MLINADHTIDELAAPGLSAGRAEQERHHHQRRHHRAGDPTGDAVVAGDVRTIPEYVAVLPATRSQLSAPILWEDAVVGVITLESDRINAFSEEDTYFVKQLASQAAIAIENARLFQHHRRGARPDAGHPEHGQRGDDPDRH